MSSVRGRVLGAVVMAVALLALGACTSQAEKQRQQGFCPKGFTIGDASTMTRFRPGPGRDPTDVLFQAQILQVGTACSFSKSGVEIDTRITLGVQEGPAAKDRTASFGYFVAILDAQRKVVARREFSTDFKFEGNRTRLAGMEELVENVPGLKEKDAPGYQIAVGLLVTPQELEYNRQRQR